MTRGRVVPDRAVLDPPITSTITGRATMVTATTIIVMITRAG
ncbi:hypothetical protein [Nakamurella sp.]